MQIILENEYPFLIGQAFQIKDFKTQVDKDIDAFVASNDGSPRLLFSFRKNMLPNHSYYPLLKKCFNTPILSTDNRKTAGDNDTWIQSGIIGFYDQLTPQQKKKVGKHKAGRVTAFTKRCVAEWLACLPVIQQINILYQKICPHHYKIQQKAMKMVEKELRIPKTIFTTVTVNQNWSTKTHTDKGDFNNGMSCIAVFGNQGYRGCYLGFPKRSVVVKIEPGDVIFMDSHEPHCNTPFELISRDGNRISLVCYMREDMPKFHLRTKIDDDFYYI